MRYLLLSLLLGSWAFADVDYESLVNRVRAGQDPETIKQEITNEGLAFEINRKVLRSLSRDNMPDWLIDFLIEWDNPAPQYGTSGDGDNYAYGYDDSYPYVAYNHYSPWGFRYSPLWVGSTWYWNSLLWADIGPWGGPLGYYYPYGYSGIYTGYHRGYYHANYVRPRGTATPAGFRNTNGYRRGRAVAKPGTKGTRTSRDNATTAGRATSGSTSSRKLSETRSSSERSSSPAGRSDSSSSRGTATRRN